MLRLLRRKQLASRIPKELYMKRSSLLILSLISLISTNVFAIPHENGKLLSHKEWGATNIKVTFKEKKPDQNRLAMLTSKTLMPKPASFNQLIDASSKIVDAEIKPVGNITTLAAENSLFIYNSSPTPQSYTIRHETCQLKLSDDGNSAKFPPCNYTSDMIWIDTDSYYSTLGNAVINWVAPEAGGYGFVFAVSVQNMENQVLFRSSDFQIINVPPAEKKS